MTCEQPSATQLSDCIRCRTSNLDCAASMAAGKGPCCLRCWHVSIPPDTRHDALVAELGERYP